MMAVETAPAGTCATEDAVDVGVERDATTTTMDAKRANDRGDEGGGTDEEDEEETEEREEEYLGRIRRRARGAEVGEESEEDDEEAGDEDDVGGGRGARRRRLKRANGERVVRARGVESDVDSSDSSDLEEEDEELVMERKYAETGRLTDEDVEEEDAEAKRENALESGAFDDEEAYSSDSSEGIPVVDDVEAPASGGGRKKTKKQLKKEREALLKDQERMMKKAQKRARFPGWNVVPERMSYLPLIEKLRAALANLPPPPKMQPNVCRQAPKAPTPETNAAVDARDDDTETRAEKDPIEIDMDSDEDDDVMLREILAKKMAPNPMSAVKNEPEKPADGATAAAGDDANDEREEEEEEDDSESELSEEEEDITEEEQRLQRKAAKKYFKADRKTKAKAGGELFEDEAEMSEDGGHTDDDDDDIRDDVDDIADAIDFREEAEDERRTKARTRAFMNDQLAQDDAELEKAKEVIANGYGRFDSDDRWQRRKKSNGNDESDDDMDYGPVIERPEEAVELSDDDDGEWREQAAKRRALQESCTQESLQLPNAFESVVSQTLFAAVNGRSNSLHIESQEVEEGPLARASSMPATLTRSGSQHGVASSSMLSRQSSKTFLGKKRLASKGSSLMLGNSQASRSYVFGRNDSQSQWGTADTMATSFKELGRDEDARAFGATNTANTVRNKDSGGKETKSKQSLFAMMSQGADENTTKPDVQKALKLATQRK